MSTEVDGWLTGRCDAQLEGWLGSPLGGWVVLVVVMVVVLVGDSNFY